MGSSIKKIADLFSAGSDNVQRNVAIIADRYFLFEEISFPKNSLKKAEIDAMAKLSIEGMLPPGNYEIASGFFIGKKKSSVTVFVASKDRLLSEIPQITPCQYWIPERFVSEYMQNGAIIAEGETCTVLNIDAGGFCSMGGERVSLFSDEFWTAEMHSANIKNANRMAEFAGVFFERAISRLLSVAAGLLLLFIVLMCLNFPVKLRQSSVQGNQSNVDRIKERSKLCDEIYAFATGKSSYFKRLEIVNRKRPKGMLFREFSADGSKVTRFLGTCESVAMLNEFLGNLKNEKTIAAVTATNVVSKQKETSFNLSVEFL